MNCHHLEIVHVIILLSSVFVFEGTSHARRYWCHQEFEEVVLTHELIFRDTEMHCCELI